MSILVEFIDVSKEYRPAVVRPSLIKWLVTKQITHQPIKVFDSVSFRISAGEAVGLLGGNGSGKSTLLKIIAGILRPTSGKALIYGQVLPMFSWESCFLDDLDVTDNLSLLGALVGLPARRIRESRQKILEAAGIKARLCDQLRSFSPGMKVRLALALADQSDAQILLLDETLSAGDAEFKEGTAKMLKRWKQQGRAIIHVSHDEDLLRSLADRLLILEDGTLRKLTDAHLQVPSFALLEGSRV